MRFRQQTRISVLGALILTLVWLLPALRVAAAEDPELIVNHSPRLQLGNAPLAPFGTSATDRVQVIWQTVSAGGLSTDSFTVEYRRPADPSWVSAGAVQRIDTGVGSRVNRYADITGLDYDTDYEYRVRHLSNSELVAEYQASFRTRLPSGDTTPFSFVAYGDSAYTADLTGFRNVMARVSQADPAFTLLLGDNVYSVGSHTESDARFDPTLVPEATSWAAGHIEYVGFGNHDVGTGSGLPSEQNFAVPVLVSGVSAPAQPPASERAEHNYSFDHGDVHFVTFDTNSLGDVSRLNEQLAWVEADLQASTATWNVVFGHHPVAGVPDKPEDPGDNYYQQVVPRLHAAGADLFMVGHSHTASATYPLLGESGGVATFVLDPDAEFDKGAGIVQVVSGVGGRSLRSGNYSQFPFVRAGFTTTTATAAEYGFSRVDVTTEELTISYVAADDGAVLDHFTITAPDPADTTPPNGTVTLPAPGQLFGGDEITFSGDATDNVGVAQALIAIRSIDRQQWWTGSGWAGWTAFEATLADPGAPVSGWSYDWTPPEDGRYAVWLRVDDTSGNQDPTKPWVSFTVETGGGADTTPPNGTVTLPAPGQLFGGDEITFSGDATDNVGVAQALIAIRSIDRQQWWTGSGWAGWTAFEATLADPGAPVSGWSYDWTPPEDGRYAVWLRVDDTSGNQDPTKPWVSFTVGP